MKYKYFIIIFLLVLNISFAHKTNAAATNAGFIKAPIWFSKESFDEDDLVKVYTLIFNPDIRTFSGTVVFYDNTLVLGKKTFSVKPKEAQYLSVDWNVTYGNHAVFAKIEDAKFLLPNGKYESAALTENESEKVTIQTKKRVLDEAKDTAKEGINTANTQIEKIQQGILDNTPQVIAQPVIKTANSLENFRQEFSIETEIKRDDAKKELEALNQEKTSPETGDSIEKKQETSSSSKPLMYIKTFFYTLFAYILGSKLLFYGLGVFVIFLILRLVWNKFL